MKGVLGTKYISYRKHLDIYEIIKNVNGKNEYFGRYHKLEDAIKWRDYFIEHDWDLDLRLVGSPNKNIYFKLGKYRIIKRIDGVDYYFGSYDSLAEAENRVKEIRLNGWRKTVWNNERLQETTTKNIVRLPSGNYHIKKTINGRAYYFGVFSSYSDALEEVKLLRKVDWDYDALESIDESSDGVVFVDRDKMLKTSFEKKESRPQDTYWAREVF